MGNDGRDIRRVCDNRWPRFVIVQGGLYWDGMKLVRDVRHAALYADYKVAAKDCVTLLPPEQDESEPWKDGVDW